MVTLVSRAANEQLCLETLSTNYPEPKTLASQADVRSYLWNTAAVIVGISLTAFTAIKLHSFIIAYSSLYLLLPFLAAVPLLFIGEICKDFIERASNNKEVALMQRQIDAHLQKIENYSHSQMASLLMLHGINTLKMPFTDFSMRPVKILMAVYLYHLDFLQQCKTTLNNQNFPHKLDDNSSDQEIADYYGTRSNLREWGIYGQKIQIAVLQERFYSPGRDIRGLGKIHDKKIFERYISQLHLGDNSPYFTFNDSRRAITFSMMENLSPSDIHQRLFPEGS